MSSFLSVFIIFCTCALIKAAQKKSIDFLDNFDVLVYQNYVKTKLFNFQTRIIYRIRLFHRHRHSPQPHGNVTRLVNPAINVFWTVA